MREVVFATTNKGKLATVQRALRPFGVLVVHEPVELLEIQADTTAAVAAQKARDAYLTIGRPVIALDAGFSIARLNGFPGPYVKYALTTLGAEGVARLAGGQPEAAKFVNSLAFLEEGMPEPVSFEGIESGLMLPKPIGKPGDEHWSPLATLFVPDGEQQTLAAMTEAELNAWRQRTRTPDHYLHRLGAWLRR